MCSRTFPGAALASIILVTVGLAEEPPQPVRFALDELVGQYEAAPKTQVTVRRTRSHLTGQMLGQMPFEIAPREGGKFHWKTVEATLTPQRNGQGKVTGLLFEQGTRTISFRKVSDDLPPDADIPEPAEKIVSPRLAALAKVAGDRSAVERFWNEVHDKAPLIEPIPGEAKHRWVTYLWRGKEQTKRVTLHGGLPTADEAKHLQQLAGTDVWYRTERLPSDSRFVYGFIVNRPSRVPEDLLSQVTLLARCPPRPDPLNPKEVSIQGMVGSLLELPDAPPQPWLERQPGVPAGKLAEYTLKSEVMKQERSFTVYTPARQDVKPGLLILFDGPFYLSRDEIPAPVILDNLIAKKKIPPLVAIFIKHKFRNGELSCSEPLADHLAKELVPWTRRHCQVAETANRTAVGGLSQGGLMASFCALRYADVFGNVLSQSGSYQWYPGMIGISRVEGSPGWLTRRYVESPRRPIRFHLEAGKFEHDFTASLLTENQRFRDVLEAKGYDVRYLEYSGGHDYVSWRGHFAEGLIHLFGRQTLEE